MDYDVMKKKNNSTIRKGDFTKLKDEELASQLTVIHHQLLARITPTELCNLEEEESPSEDNSGSPKTAASKMLYLTSAIERWIELELSCKDTDQPTILVKLLYIAEVLLPPQIIASIS